MWEGTLIWKVRGKTSPKKTFSLYNQILDFTKYNDRYILPTIPNVHRNLRIHFQDEMYHLAKNMFYASYNKGNIRQKYLVELHVVISLLDMMLYQMRDIQAIKKQHIDAFVLKLSTIKNIIYGWKINEELQKDIR